MTVVIDASAVVAALIDSGPNGTWMEGILSQNALAAPHLMPVEVANVLRRTVSARQISADIGALAHASLVAEMTGITPLRLLDEVVAHLDPSRRTGVGPPQQPDLLRRLVRGLGRGSGCAPGHPGRTTRRVRRAAVHVSPARLAVHLWAVSRAS